MDNNYNDVMQKITSGLTGNAEDDVKYLMNEIEQYKEHELAQEIARGVGRIIFDILPISSTIRVLAEGTIIASIASILSSSSLSDGSCVSPVILAPVRCFRNSIQNIGGDAGFSNF